MSASSTTLARYTQGTPDRRPGTATDTANRIVRFHGPTGSGPVEVLSEDVEVHVNDDELRDIYRATRTIAVVGASTDPDKPAHRIPAYLEDQGYVIIPVNPTAEEVLGEDAYASLSEIEEEIDVVDVFRPAEECPDIAREAVDIGARVLWLQEGIVSEEAAEIAGDAGMTVVMDRCMGATHQRLMSGA